MRFTQQIATHSDIRRSTYTHCVGVGGGGNVEFLSRWPT
jgi:hypothetical protein